MSVVRKGGLVSELSIDDLLELDSDERPSALEDLNGLTLEEDREIASASRAARLKYRPRIFRTNGVVLEHDFRAATEFLASAERLEIKRRYESSLAEEARSRKQVTLQAELLKVEFEALAECRFREEALAKNSVEEWNRTHDKTAKVERQSKVGLDR